MRVYLKEGLPGAIQEARRRVVGQWRPHRSVMKFVSRHCPDDWPDIQHCRFDYRVYESKDKPGRYKFTPFACWKIPYCIPCTQAAGTRRTLDALDRFARVTPKGRPPRFVHIVMTAPLTEDGQGWGGPASRDIPTFASVARASLQDIYSPDIGGIMSLQLLGERGFGKIHPHWDLTLNGWLIDTHGASKPLPRVVLENGGRSRIDAITAKRASVLQLGAHPSNVDFSDIIVGFEAYYKVLRYQMREVVDLRKMTYDGKSVEWQSYRTARRDRMPVDHFLDRLWEYSHRYGLWGSRPDNRVEFHRPFGYMRKAALAKTEGLVGGASIPHGRGCPCSECGDWERKYEADYGQWAPPEAGLSLN